MRQQAVLLLMFLLFSATVALADGGKETTATEFSAGDYVTFGRYEQDGNPENGPEDIEWLVLDTKEGKALLLSRFPLEQKRYCDYEIPANWYSSTVRKWLKEEFLNTAFTEAERKKIQGTDVDNSWDQAPDNSYRPGKETWDFVFLLSYAETAKYLPHSWQRIGEMTEYIKKKNEKYTHKFDGHYINWWLRTIGKTEMWALCVDIDGGFGGSGFKTNYVHTTVKPAMWVSMDGLKPVDTTVYTSLADTTSSMKEAERAIVRGRTLNEQIAMLNEMASLYAKEIKKAEWDVGLNSIFVKAEMSDLIPDLEGATKGKLSSKLFRDKKIITLYSDLSRFSLLGDFFIRLPEKKRAASLEEADGILYLKHYLERRADYTGDAYNRIYDLYWIDRNSGTVQKIYTKYTTPPRRGYDALYGETIPLKTLWNAVRGSIK